MIKTLKRFKKEKLITPPSWLLDNCQLLVKMGSEAYGVSTNESDIDVYGFCIPPTKYIFPHVDGLIHGFDKIPGFDQWQQHHIKDVSNNRDMISQCTE